MKVKSAASPGQAGGTSQLRPQRILLPSPIPASLWPWGPTCWPQVPAFAFSAGGQMGISWRDRKDPSCPCPYPSGFPCLVSVGGWVPSPQEGRPWPPLTAWHPWRCRRVGSLVALCLIWRSECLFIKEGPRCVWAIQTQGKTLWFLRKSEVRMALLGWPQAGFRTLFLETTSYILRVPG